MLFGLFCMLCACVPAHDQTGAMVVYEGLALSEQGHPGSIFSHLALNS